MKREDLEVLELKWSIRLKKLEAALKSEQIKIAKVTFYTTIAGVFFAATTLLLQLIKVFN